MGKRSFSFCDWGRRCQVFAVYTQKRDVTARLEKLLRSEGIACAVLGSQIETDKREAWYERRLREGAEHAAWKVKTIAY